MRTHDNRQETKMLELISSALSDLGYDLVRLAFRGSRRPTLQVMAERSADKTMSLDDCEIVSRHLSAVLDEADPITGGYVLEVSSPGIDRPLVRPGDFVRFVGHLAKVELLHSAPGMDRHRFTARIGKLTETKQNGDPLNDPIIELLPEQTETPVSVPYSYIGKARLVLTDELLKAHSLQ